jgi:16S rRNA (guanine527-N7)-methyltransferase
MSDSEAIASLCARVGLPEPPGWKMFFDLVKSWNARTDLTAARTDVDLAEVLFLDAAHLIRARWLVPSTSLIDVGAGVGAPTIPLLLSEPTLAATLVEPRRIRAAFLRTAAGTLDMVSRLTVLERRLDPGRPDAPGSPFDVALSRATFAPEVWLRVGIELADEVWLFSARAEVEPAVGIELARELRYAVPSSGAPRAIFAYVRAS